MPLSPKNRLARTQEEGKDTRGAGRSPCPRGEATYIHSRQEHNVEASQLDETDFGQELCSFAHETS